MALHVNFSQATTNSTRPIFTKKDILFSIHIFIFIFIQNVLFCSISFKIVFIQTFLFIQFCFDSNLFSIEILKGLQSIHGLTEIITYLIRLVINSMALLCVIPTALRWRRERQIMSQLENLASRLHMTSPDITGSLSPAAASAALTRINDSMRRRSTARKRRLSQNNGYDNHGFIPIISQTANDPKHHQPQITLPIFPYMYHGMYPSQNEFNASIFGLDPSHIIGPMPTMQGKLTFVTAIEKSFQFNTLESLNLKF